MGAGVPFLTLLGRTRSLIAALFMASCWLAAPAHGQALLPDAQVPVAPPATVPGQVSAPTAEVAATGAALSATATQASDSVQRVVTGAAHTVADGAPPPVEATLPAVTPSMPPMTESTGGAAPGRSP